MNIFKRILAMIGVILIVFSVGAFIISAFTGSEFAFAWYYVAWIIPVMIWVFVWIYKLFKRDE